MGEIRIAGQVLRKHLGRETANREKCISRANQDKIEALSQNNESTPHKITDLTMFYLGNEAYTKLSRMKSSDGLFGCMIFFFCFVCKGYL